MFSGSPGLFNRKVDPAINRRISVFVSRLSVHEPHRRDGRRFLSFDSLSKSKASLSLKNTYRYAFIKHKTLNNRIWSCCQCYFESRRTFALVCRLHKSLSTQIGPLNVCFFFFLYVCDFLLSAYFLLIFVFLHFCIFQLNSLSANCISKITK